MPLAMKRRLATLAAAASLVLCVATLALWVQSYRAPGQAYRAYVLKESASSTSLQIVVSFTWANGLLAIGKFDGDVVRRSVERHREHQPFIRWYWLSGNYIRSRSGVLGFSKEPVVYARGNPIGVKVTIPCWFPVLIFSVLPVAWGLRMRRGYRARRGACPACGYDLRATPARCPECGAVPAAAAAR
jgi:hypothetical protein